MTNYTFTGGDERQPEQPKDTDLTHDSPHHTLGRGHTQAAPGNHTHKYSDLISLPEDTSGLYVKTIGDNMSGALQINTANGLVLHSPGDSVVTLRALLVNGRYCLYPMGNWDHSYISPVQVGNPVSDESAFPLGWAKAYFAHQISGPHGPLHAGYVGVPNGDVPSAGLWFGARATPGTWKLTVSCYGYLVATSNVNIYTGFRLKWGDGAAADYRNGVFQQAARLHCNAAMGSNRGAMTFSAFVDYPADRVGLMLGAQMQASYDGTPSTAQVGLIRMSAEFYPYSQDLPLGSGWTDI